MKYFILPTIFVVFMSSCQHESSFDIQPDRITLNTRVSALGDDASGVSWNEGDTIAVFMSDESSQSLFKFVYDGSIWESHRAMTKDEMTGITTASKIEAYTPWRDGFSKTSVSLPLVEGIVDQGSPEKLKDSDFLYSNSSSSFQDYKLNLQFEHRLAQIKIIYTYSEDMQNVAPSDVHILNQPCIYTQTDGIWVADGASPIVSIVPYTLHADIQEQGQKANGQMTAIIIPHKFTKGTELMRFKIADNEYSVVSPQDIEFKSGESVKYILAIGKYGVDSVTSSFEDWQDENLGNGTMENKKTEA